MHLCLDGVHTFSKQVYLLWRTAGAIAGFALEFAPAFIFAQDAGIWHMPGFKTVVAAADEACHATIPDLWASATPLRLDPVDTPTSQAMATSASQQPRSHQVDLEPKSHQIDQEPRSHQIDLVPRSHQIDLELKSHRIDLKLKSHHIDLEEESAEEESSAAMGVPDLWASATPLKLELVSHRLPDDFVIEEDEDKEPCTTVPDLWASASPLKLHLGYNGSCTTCWDEVDD
eukprot:jgi/Chrzof1/10193/Cz04g32070.t1